MAPSLAYKSFIREVADFPQPGILFYDITTLLKDPHAFDAVLNELSTHYGHKQVAKIVGIESRGFIVGAALASRLQVGFVPIRKAGKLPAECFEVKYTLEYGTNALAIHRDAIKEGERVLIVDDLLATGGTAEAAGRLVHLLGGDIVGLAFLVELKTLRGRDKLQGYEVHSVVVYP
jgi:adenine phosphoribosyltransferase